MTRRTVAWLLLATAILVCALALGVPFIGIMMTGSGGVGAVSAGWAEQIVYVFILFVLVVLHLVTWQLTGFSTRHNVGRWIRLGHGGSTFVVLVLAVAVANEIVLLVLLPLQFLFITAAVALSIAHPRQ